MRLSIVTAAYNEEKNIRLFYESINQGLKGLDFELIFVKDGSKDKNTKKIVP